MKKWKWLILVVLGLTLATGTFYRTEMSVYAYTEEEKQMVKDWLSAHGYPPTMAGAQQAYQDYLASIEEQKREEAEAAAKAALEAAAAESLAAEEAEAALKAALEAQQAETTEEMSTTEEETITEEETTTEMVSTEEVTETVTEEESVKEETSVEETISEIETEEDTEEPESISEDDDSFISVGRTDMVIAVVCALLCAVMICLTVRYIKKEDK